MKTLALAALCLLAIFAGAQDLPDTASTAQPPAAAVSHCGPKWLGGCWDTHRPQRGYGETFRSPWFYGPALGLFAVNAIDIEATRASGCGEASEFGRRPSRLEQYGQDFAADAAIGTMAFFLKRAHVKVLPETMLGAGIAIHARGAVHGFQANCHP